MCDDKSLNILVVDDSEIIRDRIVEVINRLSENIKIIHADNFREALKQFISLPPEIIILDIQLKDGDGMDLLNIIKSRNPNTHVIILTNYPFPIFKKYCTKYGAEYFLDKSNDFEKLQDVVSKIILTQTHY